MMIDRSAGLSAASPRTCRIASMTARSGASGVVRILALHRLSPNSSATSVNVPPMSTPNLPRCSTTPFAAAGNQAEFLTSRVRAVNPHAFGGPRRISPRQRARRQARQWASVARPFGARHAEPAASGRGRAVEYCGIPRSARCFHGSPAVPHGSGSRGRDGDRTIGTLTAAIPESRRAVSAGALLRVQHVNACTGFTQTASLVSQSADNCVPRRVPHESRQRRRRDPEA